jgi:hypothetical protein
MLDNTREISSQKFSFPQDPGIIHQALASGGASFDARSTTLLKLHQ